MAQTCRYDSKVVTLPGSMSSSAYVASMGALNVSLLASTSTNAYTGAVRAHKQVLMAQC